jgi:DUF971 family protein
MSQPVEIRRDDGGRALAVEWADARVSRLPAARLRAACRCAECTRARVDGGAAPGDADVTVAAIEPIGGYAVNLRFSDGHARGIFPWAFLREIADAISCSTPAAPAASVAAGPGRRDER